VHNILKRIGEVEVKSTPSLILPLHASENVISGLGPSWCVAPRKMNMVRMLFENDNREDRKDGGIPVNDVIKQVT